MWSPRPDPDLAAGVAVTVAAPGDAGDAAPPETGWERTLTVAGRRIRVAVRPGTARAAGRRHARWCWSTASARASSSSSRSWPPWTRAARWCGSTSPASAAPRPRRSRCRWRPCRACSPTCSTSSTSSPGPSHRVVDLLGLSWGGGIAQQFALQYPRRAGRLVLVSTGTGVMMVPARLGVLARMLTPRRYNDRSYRRAAGRRDLRRRGPGRRRRAVLPRAPGAGDRLPAPAVRAHDVDEPAGAADDHRADAGARGPARPGHPGRERPHHGIAAPARHGAPARRRAPRPVDPPARARPGRRGLPGSDSAPARPRVDRRE